MPAKPIFIVLIGAALHLCALNISAQPDARRLEVSAQATVLHLKEPIPRTPNLCFSPLDPGYSRNMAGVGGGASYRLTKHMALDGEVSYFPARPQEHFYQSDPRWQGLFGAKAGIRRRRFAVFGKARPGFLHFNGLTRINSVDKVFLQPFGCVFELVVSTNDKRTVFNFDFGGVAEFYLPKRIFIRLDAGDTIVHYPTTAPTEVNPGFTTHNFQLTAGIGFRF